MISRAIMTVLVSGLLVAACAHVRVTGQDFNSAAFASMHLRQTTPQQAEALLGPPFNRMALQSTATNPRGPLPVGTPIRVGIMKYIYALSSGGPASSGRPVAKTATLVFWNGTLAAYDLLSSIPGEENAPVDEARLPQLQQGITTRNDVVGLMGPPSGQSIAVSATSKLPGHMTYIWTHYDGPTVRHKSLVIDFDSNDVMTHYTLLDSSGPLPVFPAHPQAPGGAAPFMPYVPPYQAPQPKSAPPVDVPQAPVTRI